jgi:hypothetical protein
MSEMNRDSGRHRMCALDRIDELMVHAFVRGGTNLCDDDAKCRDKSSNVK